MTDILLKARPTVDQLRDRIAPPSPDGLELYLDRGDLTSAGWRGAIRDNVDRFQTPAGFIWIVEAPIRTLDDEYFDLTRNDDDHRETIRRVVEVGLDLGAVAANIHVVAPVRDAESLTHSERQRCLVRSLDLLRFYVERCGEAGLVPQVENIPPVGRMREGAFVFSPIGSAPADLSYLGGEFPSLRFTVDTSHAALFLNWQNAGGAGVERGFERVAAFHREIESVGDLRSFLNRLVARTTTVHVSNATGLMGEGLRYADGAEDLDNILRPLVGRIPYFVTETLEPDPHVAGGMRDAQARLQALLASVEGAVA